MARLHVGDPAPQFTATAVDGAVIDLAALRGQPVLLSFFRYTGCPLCSLRFWYFNERYADWHAAGLQVIAFFESAEEVVRAYAEEYGATFPVISDVHRQCYRRYMVEHSWPGFLLGFLRRGADFRESKQRGLAHWLINGPASRMPAQFLLHPDLTIAVAHYGSDMGDFLPLTAINTFVERHAQSIIPIAPDVIPHTEVHT